jgi:hypothetical protein
VEGDGDLIVAAQLNDQTAPVGFHLDGTPAELSLSTPPTTPTLVIVPTETNFVTPLDASWGNVNDAMGTAIGTLRHGAKSGSVVPRGAISLTIVDPCGDPDAIELPPECYSGGGGSTPATYPAGLYLDYVNIYDWKESWPRGDPEIEAHLIGPTFDPSANGEHLSCTAQTQSGPKYYDQNGHDWSAPVYSVEGQLFTADELTRYQAVYNKPFVIQFWEDDQEACEIRKDDKSQLQQVSEDLSTVYHAASVIVNLLTYTYPGTFVFSSSDVTALRALGHLNLWDNEDDYLGQVTLQSDVGIYHAGMTHTLVLDASGTSLSENGYMRLRYRQ